VIHHLQNDHYLYFQQDLFLITFISLSAAPMQTEHLGIGAAQRNSGQIVVRVRDQMGANAPSV